MKQYLKTIVNQLLDQFFSDIRCFLQKQYVPLVL
jgi:small basic protein